MTPLQTALGEAGGFGFGGRAGVVREETARVIAELTGTPLPAGGTRAALDVPAAANGRPQADGPDN
jgi:hypothetical protein